MNKKSVRYILLAYLYLQLDSFSQRAVHRRQRSIGKGPATRGGSTRATVVMIYPRGCM